MFNDLNVLALVDEEVEFLPIVSIEDHDEKDRDIDYPDKLPILPLRNTVLFPGVVIPITVGRDKSVKAIKAAYENDKLIGVVSQKVKETEDPTVADLNTVGTIARIIKMLKMPDGSTTVIIHGRERFRLMDMIEEEPFFYGNIQVLLADKLPKDKPFEALVASLKDIATQIVGLSPNIPAEANIVLKNIDKPAFLVHFISSNLSVGMATKQRLLELDDVRKRAEEVLELLNTEFQMLELKNQIQSKVRNDMDQQQRNYFLHQQIKTIQEELGDDNAGGDVVELKKRAKDKKWNKTTKEAFEKELKKLKRLNPAAPEYGMSINYLELMLDLPWNEFTEDSFDLKEAQKVLNKDHYGLEKIKNRILEYLAVLKLKGDMKSPILCFVGPPGVGKTSLGRSIAAALQRKYIRMSLGGVRDESEIRGHRRTYIGSRPGRIIQSLRKAKTSNPVFILDEIDKVGNDFRGDPSSALLEVLDPEQNHSFYDNYLEQEYDLSKVMFIATANSLNSLHPALRDRMEIIRLSGYSVEEKMEIAKKHLISKQRKEHGLASKHIKLNKKTLVKIIDEYTRESGVRGLERNIASVMRSVAKSVALEEEYQPSIKPEDVSRILGPAKFDKDMYQKDIPTGVAVGLAWTSSGGDILFLETSLSVGKGNLTLTGNLGNVMKESATTALSYIKAHIKELGIDAKSIAEQNIHLHVPEGGIPKDGPSAGITILTALTSALTKRKIKPYLAMTGEITLRGKVLPVGGIKEKILAAKRAGIKEVMLCKANEKDVLEINPAYIKGVKFHYVEKMQTALKIALK